MYHLTLVSMNKKTGPIPVTVSEENTCPDACPFKKESSLCYAKLGPLRLHWNKVSEGKRGMDWKSFLAAIKKLPNHILIRHNAAGDLPGNNNSINSNMLKELVAAFKNKKAFSYSHKPVLDGQENSETISNNRAAIKHANENGFTINLSANSPEHADKLMALKIAPVASIVNSEQKKNFVTAGGNRVVICPATIRDNVSCSRCGLCQKANREYIIGFPAHGISFKRVNALIEQAA